MYLFKPYLLARYARRSQIYIPLCIYLNWISCIMILSMKNLHSTMYLFQQLGRSLDSCIRLYLHSTMYLFQRVCACESNHQLTVIYIPLCIYFNVIQLINMFHFGENLHSTMYLFQPVLYDRNSYLVLIYIPLCIYFNRWPCQPSSAPFNIYIPLCIYFNDTTTSTDTVSATFTFHYVSIST